MKLVLRKKNVTDEEIQSAPTGPKVGDAAGSSYQSPSFNMMDETNLEDAGSAKRHPHIAMLEECGCGCDECSEGEHHPEEDEEELTQDILAGLYHDPEVLYVIIGEESLTEGEKKKGDRCIRIAKRKYNRWPCVPLYSEALTKQGWRLYQDLKIGDLILAYDIDSDTLKWTEIKNLHFYKDAQTIKMHKQHFNIVSTADHKWLAYNKNSGTEKIINNDKLENILQTIKEVNEKTINKKEAEAKCKSFRYYYKNYNGKTKEQIIEESKLSKGGINLTETKNLKNSMALLTTARLDNCYRPLQIEQISKYGDNWIEKILSMSADQIDAFFASAIIYDGNQNTDLLLEKNVGTRNTENTYGFKQKDEMHGDVFELAAFLSGRNVTRGRKNKYGITSFYVRDKRYIPLDVMRFSEDQEQDVWCPETEFGTWVMRQNNRIVITGNSAYASGAVVKCRQGKIWKGLKESAEHIEYEVYEATLEEATLILEKYKANFSLEKSQGLHGWFKRNKGKGWIDCRTGKPCGRKKAGPGAKRKYPACRPTKSQCNKAGTRRKRGKAAVSWKPKKDK